MTGRPGGWRFVDDIYLDAAHTQYAGTNVDEQWTG